MSTDNWGKYLRAKEPGVREKAYAWKTAIGLQKVDGCHRHPPLRPRPRRLKVVLQLPLLKYGIIISGLETRNS